MGLAGAGEGKMPKKTSPELSDYQTIGTNCQPKNISPLYDFTVQKFLFTVSSQEGRCTEGVYLAQAFVQMCKKHW